MDNIWFQVIFGANTLYFGASTWQVLPTLWRLLVALLKGAVKWPGPRIHDPNPSASRVRERLGVGYENLFPAFVWNALGVMGGFIFFLSIFISSMPFMNDYIRIKSVCGVLFVSLIALAGANMAFKKAQSQSVQVNALLSSLGRKEEPRAIEGESAEAEYAIEHPLIGYHAPAFVRTRALDLYYESVRCHQEGNEFRATSLSQEALAQDPSLHEHASAALMKLSQNCNEKEAGAVYYWLGIHSENLHDWKQAANWYEKAIQAFGQLNYRKRESKAHCNLGHVKMQMHDPSGMEEFEKAIALNPKNGTAHLNIARLYYSISDEGDERYERALDAFADAIIADPLTYGPKVVSSLREIGYTWKQDMEKITKKIENKQHESTK